jgi:V/A-type H+-transporting ATPase subunit I
MEKVRVIALESDRRRIVSALHGLRIIDLRRSSLAIEDDKPASYSTEISDALIRINGALQVLEKRAVHSERHIPVEKVLDEVRSSRAIDRIYALSGEMRAISEDTSALEYAGRVAGAFSGLGVDFGKLKSDYVLYRAFEMDKKALAAFRKGIGKEGRGMESSVSPSENGRYLVFVAYDRKIGLDEEIKGAGTTELDLSARYLDGKPKDILKSVHAKAAAHRKRAAEIGSEIKTLSDRNYSRLTNLAEMLGIELARADAGAMFKRTASTFVVEGWIEKRKLAELKEKVGGVAHGRFEIETLEHDELAPTHTNRPAVLKPFEYLLNFYSTQRSDEVDPTWIFVLSFPIFYGLMVSDVGYGIASLLFVTYVSRLVDKEGLVYNACKIWQLMSVAAIFFGVMSNQYFGFQLNQYIIPGFVGFDWMKNATTVMAVTILFGIVQIVLGLFFGFVNHYSRKHMKMAISKLTSIVVILAGTVAVSALFGLTGGALPIVSAAIAVLALLVTLAISGHEATEITNLITHPLSYARIMGFGLGSVIIAFLIDQYFTPNLSGGILVFIIYLVIFMLLHFLNMLLGIFEGIVQGARLNFVEFFSKFYMGNGVRFKPFGYKRTYTKEEKE